MPECRAARLAPQAFFADSADAGRSSDRIAIKARARDLHTSRLCDILPVTRRVSPTANRHPVDSPTFREDGTWQRQGRFRGRPATRYPARFCSSRDACCERHCLPGGPRIRAGPVFGGDPRHVRGAGDDSELVVVHGIAQVQASITRRKTQADPRRRTVFQHPRTPSILRLYAKVQCRQASPHICHGNSRRHSNTARPSAL